MSFTIADLGLLIGTTKERAKQLVSEEFARDPSLDLDKSNRTWKVGPKMLSRVFQRRGIQLPTGKIVTIAVQKGGVGKTTLTLNIAGELARAGYRVLVIDGDPEAHSTNFLAPEEFDRKNAKVLFDAYQAHIPLKDVIQPSRFSNLDFIPSALRNCNFEKAVGQRANPKHILRRELEKIDGYNVIFLDLSPSITLLTSCGYLAADLVAMPVNPDAYSLESIPLTKETIRELAETYERSLENVEFKIIFNNIKAHHTTHDALEYLLTHFKNELYPYYVKHAIDVVKYNNAGLLLSESKTTELTDAIRNSAYIIGDFPKQKKEREAPQPVQEVAAHV